MRVCKERLRKYKEKEQTAETRSLKIHEQMMKLTKRNKELSESIRKHEAKHPQDNSKEEVHPYR